MKLLFIFLVLIGCAVVKKNTILKTDSNKTDLVKDSLNSNLKSHLNKLNLSFFINKPVGAFIDSMPFDICKYTAINEDAIYNRLYIHYSNELTILINLSNSNIKIPLKGTKVIEPKLSEFNFIEIYSISVKFKNKLVFSTNKKNYPSETIDW